MKEIRPSNTTLIARYLKGDEKAFETLVLRHKNMLFSMLMLITKDTSTSEDLFQETFIKVVEILRKGNYEEKGKFSYWVQRMAYNLAIDYFRKNQRTPIVSQEVGREMMEGIAYKSPSMESYYIEKDKKKELHRRMRELPEKQRQVVVMRHYLKMSFQEIATRMGTSVNTALGRMRYALIFLRKKINKNTPHNEKYRGKTQKAAYKLPISRNRTYSKG